MSEGTWPLLRRRIRRLASLLFLVPTGSPLDVYTEMRDMEKLYTPGIQASWDRTMRAMKAAVG